MPKELELFENNVKNNTSITTKIIKNQSKINASPKCILHFQDDSNDGEMTGSETTPLYHMFIHSIKFGLFSEENKSSKA